jgi:hypothetical protein
MSELPPFRFTGYSTYPSIDDQSNDPRTQFNFSVPTQDVNPGPFVLANMAPIDQCNQVSPLHCVSSLVDQPQIQPFLPLPIRPADDDEADAPQKKKIGRPTAAAKVAGSRRKPLAHKGKENMVAAIPDGNYDDLIAKATKRRGRPSGSSNFITSDVSALLDMVKLELPCGPQGWVRVHARYTIFARQNGRPFRTAESLETKFKQVSISRSI